MTVVLLIRPLCFHKLPSDEKRQHRSTMYTIGPVRFRSRRQVLKVKRTSRAS